VIRVYRILNLELSG